jgi:hypothetical protein
MPLSSPLRKGATTSASEPVCRRPQFTCSEGISRYLACENRDEIDVYGSRLSAGGNEGRCGWLKDRFDQAGMTLRDSFFWPNGAHYMSKRLQVILDDDDMKAIATLARKQ